MVNTEVTTGTSSGGAAASRQHSRRQKVLIVLGAALGLGCGFGPMFYSVIGIFLKPMASSLSWSRADISMLPMLGMIGTAVGAPFLGYIADRRGWKQVNAYSIAFFALGLLAIALAPRSLAYVLAVALFVGIAGAATAAPGYIPIIALVFDQRLGLAMGITMVGSGVAAGIMPAVVAKLLQEMDWRQAYLCLAAASLLLGVLAHNIIFRSFGPEQRKASGGGATTQSPAKVSEEKEGVTLGQAVSGYRFWLLCAFSTLVTGTTLGAIVHLAAYATDRGISPMFAAQSMGLIGVGLTVARIAAGFLLDKIFAPYVAVGATLIGAAGFFLLTSDIAQSPWMLPVAAAVFGISTGAEGDIIPFLAKKYFGVKNLGSIFGILFTFVALGGALGTYIFGLSYDLLKSYLPILQASGLLGLICAFSVLLLGPYRYPSSDAAR